MKPYEINKKTPAVLYGTVDAVGHPSTFDGQEAFDFIVVAPYEGKSKQFVVSCLGNLAKVASTVSKGDKIQVNGFVQNGPWIIAHEVFGLTPVGQI